MPSVRFKGWRNGFCTVDNVEGGSMKNQKYASWMCGLASAALLLLPGAAAFADTSSPVTCKDGTTSTHGGRGSCSGHGGIDKAATAAAAGGGASGAAGSSAPAATPTPAAKAAPPPPPAAAPAAPPATTSTAAPKAPPASQAAAPGGGPGMVWVNSASKVYHCPSDRWYGKTKAGEYMTEADAKAKGNRADHNKPCS
jgi:hypothetical protein